MKKLISFINSILAKKTNLNPNESWIYGLSGGQDSVLLFLILFHIKKQWNIQMKIVHFHHFWQQKNFFSSQQVWQLSFLFKNSLYIFVSESFLENEKKARNWRKNGFERVSSIEKSKKILLGHTATDRIETAFWHLIRGTSSQGLVSLKLQTIAIAEIQFFHFPTFFILGKNFFVNSKTSDFISNQFSQKYIYKKLKNKKRLKTSLNSSRNNNNKEDNSRKKTSKDCSFCSLTKEKKRKNLHNFQLKNQIDKVIAQKKNHFNEMQSFPQKGTFCQTEIFSFFVFKHSSSPEIFKKLPSFSTFVLFNFFFSKKFVVRPFLFIHRNDVAFFIKKSRIPLISDPTNEKLCWSRNRLRYQLVPLIKIFFNPNIEYLFTNYLEITNEEQKYIEFLLSKINKCLVKNEQNNQINKKLSNSLENLLHFFPIAIQRRLLQKIFQSYTGLQPKYYQIEILKNSIKKSY